METKTSEILINMGTQKWWFVYKRYLCSDITIRVSYFKFKGGVNIKSPIHYDVRENQQPDPAAFPGI